MTSVAADLICGLIGFSQIHLLSTFLGWPKLYYSFQKCAGGDLSSHHILFATGTDLTVFGHKDH